MRKALTLVAALAVSAGAAHASTVDLSAMTLNGTASYNGPSDTITLTPSLNSQTGSAFIATPIAITPATTFSAHFELNFSAPGGGGADGVTFTIQNSAAGASALGSGGGFLGYSGIGSSVAVEFDTWRNSWDPNANHVGINTNGSVTSLVTANPGFTIETSDPIFAWVDYDGTTLDVFTSTTNVKPGTSLLSSAIDLAAIVGSEAYFGFTGATGGARNTQKVSSFSLEVAAVPLPASAPLLVSALMVAGFAARRKARSAA